MVAKMRMQVGETVISWGVMPEPSPATVRAGARRVRPQFAVIEGGLRPMDVEATDLPLRARSA